MISAVLAGLIALLCGSLIHLAPLAIGTRYEHGRAVIDETAGVLQLDGTEMGHGSRAVDGICVIVGGARRASTSRFDELQRHAIRFADGGITGPIDVTTLVSGRQ